MKKLLIILILLISTNGFSQIRVEDIGDDWRSKVNIALDTIKKYDIEKYNNILKVCNHVTFWNGNFSTTEDSTTIMISQKDMLYSFLTKIPTINVKLLEFDIKMMDYYKKNLEVRK